MTVLSKEEIYRRMDRFNADPKRYCSYAKLGEILGMDQRHLRSVFQQKDDPMTELLQHRMSRALIRMERGDFAIVNNGVGSTKVVYHMQRPRPRLKQGWGLKVSDDGKVGLDIGPKNILDYSRPRFRERFGSQ